MGAMTATIGESHTRRAPSGSSRGAPTHPVSASTLPERQSWASMDGNEAVARVSYALSEVCAIYPITPSSPMGEHADQWAAAGKPNLYGSVPDVLEMQSEAGAAGALHGAVTTGALGTSFTASQGLLLWIPDMYKIAGELTPAVLHVAARTLATHALSIFGDHSDVMAVRGTGWTMLTSSSVQEAHDMAAVAHAAALASSLPVLHFFDGFRTSHEVARIRQLTGADLSALVDPAWIARHRDRGLSPDTPQLRGTAQNPDVFFQAREAANPQHAAVPGVVAQALATLGERTGRHYSLVDYVGHPEAERAVVLMGSAAGAAREAVNRLVAEGERVGLLLPRMYRPFPADALLEALPDTVRGLAVLDRTKEPGAPGEPLYLDVVAALAGAAAQGRRDMPHVAGGRYGLGGKEVRPAMIKAALDHVRTEGRPGSAPPRHGFTVGIVDDITHTSLDEDPDFDTDVAEARVVLYGLGSDGTVSAAKEAVKIVADQRDWHTQGYFVYDSRKAGSVTVSHLRFSEQPIDSSYLVRKAGFVGVHQFSFFGQREVLEEAEQGATVLVNAPYPAEEIWDRLPREVQEEILAKELRLWSVDAYRIAKDVGLGRRINSVMVPAFLKLSGALPSREVARLVKASFAKTYGNRGAVVVAMNEAAVDRALDSLVEVPVPGRVTSDLHRRQLVGADAPDFVQRVTARMIDGKGDLLPVSALPADGSFPTGTAPYEKREIALEIPIWDPSICIDCGKCAIVCPHAAIRMKVYPPEANELAPEGFPSKPFKSRDLPGHELTIQVAPDDCTGCGICVEVCPARSKSEAKHKAINLEPVEEHREVERERFTHFLGIPELDRTALPPDTIKGSQVLQPLFEFSGACSGCGETPYLKLMSQLYGDRAVVANATGCSSIYGGNLPTTPWGSNPDGRGPAWSNSLFEDNAEFGLGMRMSLDHAADLAVRLVTELGSVVGDELVAGLIAGAHARDEEGIAAQRDRTAQLLARLDELEARGDLARQGRPDLAEAASSLRTLAPNLVRRSVWIVGGDGWAYDIGFGGLDHALASGRDVNILVMDTEVYSNTGGQSSKSTPRAAVAKFATSGKRTPKKDLGMIAMAYGSVYVAQVALGANDVQAVRAFTEAEAWPGPSLILAYSTCIAHGIDMRTSMAHQKDLVKSGYWPLFRYRPGPHADGETTPLHLDSRAPAVPFSEVSQSEGRYAVLRRIDPEAAEVLDRQAQEDIDARWKLYEQLAGISRWAPAGEEEQ